MHGQQAGGYLVGMPGLLQRSLKLLLLQLQRRDPAGELLYLPLRQLLLLLQAAAADSSSLSGYPRHEQLGPSRTT